MLSNWIFEFIADRINQTIRRLNKIKITCLISAYGSASVLAKAFANYGKNQTKASG